MFTNLRPKRNTVAVSVNVNYYSRLKQFKMYINYIIIDTVKKNYLKIIQLLIIN